MEQNSLQQNNSNQTRQDKTGYYISIFSLIASILIFFIFILDTIKYPSLTKYFLSRDSISFFVPLVIIFVFNIWGLILCKKQSSIQQTNESEKGNKYSLWGIILNILFFFIFFALGIFNTFGM